MKSLELKWGIAIAGASAAWLYGGALAGLHSRSLGLAQGVLLAGFALVFAGYFLFFREYFRREPEARLREAMRSGLSMTALLALAAPLTQWGYLTLVNPGWTDFVHGELVEHYAVAGLDAESAEAVAEQAIGQFSVGATMLKSALAAIFVGAMATLAFAGAFRWSRRRAEGA